MNVMPVTSPNIEIHEACVPDFIFDQIASPENSLIKLSGFGSKGSAKYFSPKKFESHPGGDACIGLHPLLLGGFAADFDGTNVFDLEIVKMK